MEARCGWRWTWVDAEFRVREGKATGRKFVVVKVGGGGGLRRIVLVAGHRAALLSLCSHQPPLISNSSVLLSHQTRPIVRTITHAPAAAPQIPIPTESAWTLNIPPVLKYLTSARTPPSSPSIHIRWTFVLSRVLPMSGSASRQ